jgi:phage terminase large subunit GpA-like protein
MGSPALERVLRLAIEGWRPPPNISVAEWAERFRYLTAESSAEPGQWRNNRAPHLVAPMEALSPHSETRKVVFKASSQSGKTEILLNFIGYIIDCDPGPILAVQPNIEPMGERFSKQRIAPMLKACPTLAEKVAPAKSRDSSNTILEKFFPSGQLFIGGANSPAGLASMPIRYFLGDEIDRWEVTREGDAMSLARERLETYRSERREKELLVSSPTYDDIGISVEYEKCEQKFERHLRCNHCGETQFPRLKHFRWDEGKPNTVRYYCEHCGGEHHAKSQRSLKLTAEWVKVKDQGIESSGFWMNRWTSPFSRWEDIIRKWIDAGSDPAKRQVVTNTSFAEGWEGEGERVDAHILEQRCEDYPALAPQGVAAITIGVDVQQDRLEAEIVGWGMVEGHLESWSLGYEVLIGEPTDPEVWQDLRELYQSHWEHESGAKLKPAMMCVDSGAWSKVVYEWVKSMRDRAIVPIKGSSNFSADALTGTDRDRRKRSTKRLANGRPAEMIGVSQIKLLIQRQLAAPQGKHGYCHFPTGRSREYFDQLTGERLMIEQKRGKRPTRAWVKVHSAVEALDCRVYAYAALLLSGVDLEKEATNILIEKPATLVQKKPMTVSRRQQVRSRIIR